MAKHFCNCCEMERDCVDWSRDPEGGYVCGFCITGSYVTDTGKIADEEKKED